MIPIQLLRALDRKSVPHLLLFIGPKGSKKEEAAYAFAKKILCESDPQGHCLRKIASKNHPDLHLYHPEGKTGMHSMLSMQNLIQEMSMQPFEAAWKVFLIHDAERMLPSSSNALLKTFEEPASQSVILLLASSVDLLLPTIVSRCRCFFFVEEKCAEPDALCHLLLERLMQGSLFQSAEEIARILEAEKKNWEEELGKQQLEEKEIFGLIALRYQEKVSLLFETILEWYRDLQLIFFKVSPKFLFYPSHVSQMESFLKTYPLPKFEFVEKSVKEARLGIERGIKFTTCLETLALKFISL